MNEVNLINCCSYNIDLLPYLVFDSVDVQPSAQAVLEAVRVGLCPFLSYDPLCWINLKVSPSVRKAGKKPGVGSGIFCCYLEHYVFEKRKSCLCRFGDKLFSE